MAMNVGGDESDEVISAINTTPLVDVMLVLLIIFLITIPAITHTIPVQLPKERVQPLQTPPKPPVEIAVNKVGKVFWGTAPIDNDTLVAKLKSIAVMNPQPEVHIRGDQATQFAAIGRVITDCERAGIAKLGFITEPPARSAD